MTNPSEHFMETLRHTNMYRKLKDIYFGEIGIYIVEVTNDGEHIFCNRINDETSPYWNKVVDVYGDNIVTEIKFEGGYVVIETSEKMPYSIKSQSGLIEKAYSDLDKLSAEEKMAAHYFWRAICDTMDRDIPALTVFDLPMEEPEIKIFLDHCRKYQLTEFYLAESSTALNKILTILLANGVSIPKGEIINTASSYHKRMSPILKTALICQIN